MIRSALVFFLVVFAFGVQAENAVPAPPQLAAKAYLLMDATSGAVLVEHNADERLPPASLTKMMTAYVLAEDIGLGHGAGDVVATAVVVLGDGEARARVVGCDLLLHAADEADGARAGVAGDPARLLVGRIPERSGSLDAGRHQLSRSGWKS